MKQYKFPVVSTISNFGVDMWLYDIVWCRSHGNDVKEAKTGLEVAFSDMYEFFTNVLHIDVPIATDASYVLNDDGELVEEMVFTVPDTECEMARNNGFISALNNFRLKVGVYEGKSISNNKFCSQICRPSDMSKFIKWLKLIEPKYLDNSLKFQHRKWWEFCFITQVLHERGLLGEGKRGLGFAVGREPLPALFAALGTTIVATDIDISTQTAKHWYDTGKNAGNNVDSLYYPNICDEERFLKNVSFRSADMNCISGDLNNFDFCWSSCAFEHLGSIGHGEQFLYNMIRTLKPGGVAVHTTEINITSNGRTVERGGSVIFRKCDFERFAENLENMGCEVEPLDFRLDGTVTDEIIDFPPYDNCQNGWPLAEYNQMPHFKLIIGGYVSTSFGIIIKKNV